MNLINQNQIRGLVNTISSLNSQLDALNYVSSTGGFISGDVTILNSNLTVTGGSFNVSGDPFYLNSGNGRFGINISSPSGNIHIYSQEGTSSIWLEANPLGSLPSVYPSIKFLNDSSGVSTEMGIIASSNPPFTNASGDAFFINHGASLASDESNAQRAIQFSINDNPIMELHTGHAAILEDSLLINSAKFSSVSGTLTGPQETTVDSTYMFDYVGVKYNLSIYNETGSRLEEFFMTWPTGNSEINYTGMKSPSVNSTSDVVISGLKSGNYALLRASSTDDDWNVAGIANYLF